ncbi:MAG: ABC transporter permease [Roseburia sp.]|nr:ABC transporter permease [Anaeroplasma bactoclasticum]MCM1195953.1 ABC transporter permease [Roseburia sp.]MCM1555905.1 ABC transporter permease [Anaeroplasma bactoclasticum]
MMTEEVKFPKATIEEYGYKDYRILATIWKVLKILLVIFSIFMLYLSVIVIAIQSFNSSASTTEFQGFTFDNYLQMFSKRSLTNSIKNTFLVSITATLIAAVLGTFVAIGIFYLPPKIKSRLMLLNNIPLLNADIVTGISLMLIFSLLLPINRHIFGFWTILIAHLFFIFPYIILSVLPKMKEIDPNLMDASMDLGIKPLKSVIRVLIPAISGGIFSGVVLAFTISFEDFVVGYFTTGNGFNTLSIWIYSSIGKKSLFPGVYAFSTALTIVSMILIILYAIWKKGRRSHAKKN